MMTGKTYCEKLSLTLADGSCEARYLTEILDGAGNVIRLEPESRNFSVTQKAEFLARLESVAAVQMIEANSTKVAAEKALEVERIAHTETQSRLAVAEAEIARLSVV